MKLKLRKGIDKSLMKFEDDTNIDWAFVQRMGRIAPDNDVFGISFSFRVSEIDFSKAIEIIEVSENVS